MSGRGQDYVGLKERSLEVTPSWAVAGVVFVILIISIALEYALHFLSRWLHKNQKRSLHEALEKIKAGFISLLLTVGQDPIADICIPSKIARTWHPCNKDKEDDEFYDPCLKKGKVQLVSNYGIHQLQIFIIVLALLHVLYSILTLVLGRLQMRKWRAWEDETKTFEFKFQHDPTRFTFVRESSFVRRHLRFWSNSTILLWIDCFFTQFFTSIAKVDYLTLRHGFINTHLTPESQLHFRVLIQFICSYVTVPLYALVTQMGSRMKPTIFSDNVVKALKTWHHTTKKNVKHGTLSAPSSSFSRRPGTALHGSTSPMHLLHPLQNVSLESLSNSPRHSGFEHEGWANESPSTHHHHRYQERENFRRDDIEDEIRDEVPDFEEIKIQEPSSSSTQLPSGPRLVRTQHEL